MTREEFIKMMGERVKLVRTEYSLNQDKMAYILGISKKTLIEIEKGRISLGWTASVAMGTIFPDSTILQNDFGGEVSDLISSIAFSEITPIYPSTMGGRVWWKDIKKIKGYRIQQNIISQHYRLLDKNDGRIISSFDLKIIEDRLNDEIGEE